MFEEMTHIKFQEYSVETIYMEREIEQYLHQKIHSLGFSIVLQCRNIIRKGKTKRLTLYHYVAQMDKSKLYAPSKPIKL